MAEKAVRKPYQKDNIFLDGHETKTPVLALVESSLTTVKYDKINVKTKHKTWEYFSVLEVSIPSYSHYSIFFN